MNETEVRSLEEKASIDLDSVCDGHRGREVLRRYIPSWQGSETKPEAEEDGLKGL